MPQYQQLERQLSALIEKGVLPPGATLPPGRKLAEELGLSRATVQKCYDALRNNGLLRSHGRLGFIVQSGARVEPRMERLKGFTEEMQELGRVPSSRILERSVVTDRSIASLFHLPAKKKFLKLIRVRFGDGLPMTKEVAWYNLTAAPALENDDLSGSVYELLRTYGAGLTFCEQTIEASLPDETDCEIFGFAQPRPCLLIKRRSYDKRSRLIEYVEGLFRGDAYSYRLSLSI